MIPRSANNAEVPQTLSHRRRSARRHRGHTLLEITMVLAIIVVMLSILLPAIQSARDAARRTQCRNNLLQISLAVHTYEDTYAVLPPGTISRTGPIVNLPDGYHYSWSVQLLPYMDQRSLYETIDDEFEIYSTSVTVSSTHLSSLICPAVSEAALSTNASSYAGCYGDSEVGIDFDNNGSFFRNSSLSRKSIRDGTSNTIFFGEKVASESDLGWYSGTSSTLRNTAATPNNPLDRTMEYGSIRNGGFSSNHRTGTIFSMGDGSVRLIRDEVDADVFHRLGNRYDGELIDTNF